METTNQKTPLVKKIKFFNGLTTRKKVIKEKLKNKFIKQYEEIPPYAKNQETGEILNPTDKFLYKEIEPKNIYDYIQSNAKDADIVSKIKNMTSGQMDAKNGVFLDTTKIGNLHQEHEKTLAMEKELELAEIAVAKKKEELKKQQTIDEYLKKQEEEKKKQQPQPKE